MPHFIDPLLSGGGVNQDLAPHGISKAFWPVGAGSRVVACENKVMERRRNPRDMSGKSFVCPVDYWVESELELFDPRTNSNYTMSVKTSWCGGFRNAFMIEGEKGKMTDGIHFFRPAPLLIDNNKKKTFPVDKDQWEPHNPYVREIEQFADCILHDKPTDAGAEYALRLEETLSIQYFSKLMKRKVTMDELDAWADEILANADDEQKAIDDIALQFTGAIDLK